MRSLLHRSFAVLSSSIALLAAVSPSPAQTCPAGSAAVSVGFVDLDGDGIPDAKSKSKERREHAVITEGLRQALNLSVDPGEDVNPQIRIIVDDPLLLSGAVSTANFTVVDVLAGDLTQRVDVYDREDSSDEDSGYFKLFENRTVTDLGDVCATVRAVAPSSTTTSIDGGVDAVTQHFPEPNAAHGFTETVRRHDDHRFVLLVPHGADIEEGTSEQIPSFRSVLEGTYGVDVNLWETGGTWFGAESESEHWHITSSAVSGASFPGLGALLADPPFNGDRPFQYALSLHGFGDYEGNGLVIGGRAHREAKCFLADRVQQRLEAEGKGAVAYYIWDLDDDDTNNIDLPDVRNVKITDERPDVGLSGRDRDNIVNRASPSEGLLATFGGFQIEESRPLRDDPAVSILVAQELAHGIAQLIGDPNAIGPAGTAVCDALVSGQIVPTASISGRLWQDLDGDGQEAITEPGLSGATVELLDGSSAVLGTATTAGDGGYAFGSLYAGDYRIRFTVPGSFDLVTQDIGGNTPASELVDSDADPATGETALLSLAHQEQRADVDAGAEATSVPCHDVTPVAFGSTWRTSPSFVDHWFELGFVDSGWPQLQATLGYPADDVEKGIPEIGVASYFRLAFEVPDPSLFDTLDLSLFRDDGGVVYLNGIEVLRSNMPAGTISPTTTASRSSRTTDTTSISGALLRTGTNVLAVEVHERRGTSNPDDDLAFDLELSSTVCRPCVTATSFDADRGTYLRA
ncbi:MAG: SdrD B-like domain-containing protein, partial [Acidobacteriota bacterium]